MSPRRPQRRGGPTELVGRLERLVGDHEGAGRFLRGLAIGALVGAAAAGSTFWERRRDRPRATPEKGEGSDAT